MDHIDPFAGTAKVEEEKSAPVQTGHVDPFAPVKETTSKSKARQFIENTAGILDIAASAPTAMIGLAGNLARTSMDLIQGEPDAWKHGRQIQEEIMKIGGNPIQKALGMEEEAQTTTGAGKAMGKVGEAVGTAASKVADLTGQPPETIMTVLDSLMMVTPAIAKMGYNKLVETKQKLSSGKTKEATSDMQDWLGEQGIKATPAQVEHAITNYPIGKRDATTGAPKESIYNKVEEPTPRVPVERPDTTMQDAMGTAYSKDLEAQMLQDKYTKEATAQRDGELPQHEVVMPPEVATPEQLGQTAQRIPEGPVDVPATPKPLSASGYGVGNAQGGAVDPALLKGLGVAAGAATGAVLAGGESPGERLFGLVSGGLGALALTKIPGMRDRAATKHVDALELAIAKGVAQGIDPATTASVLPREVLIRAKKGGAQLGRTLEIPKTKEEASDIVQFYTSNRLQDSATMKADHILGVLSTRLGNESKELLRQNRGYEQRIREIPHNLMTATDPFKEKFVKLPNQEAAASELLSGEFDRFKSRLDPEGKQYFDIIVGNDGLLSKLGDSLVETGIMSSKIPNYWPRMVKDLPGLLSTFGKVEKVRIQELLDNANKKMLDSSNKRPLNKVEESILIDSYLRGYPIKGYKPGFAKQRMIEKISPEMAQYYEHPIEALHSYIHNSVVSLEKAKLFGQDLKFKNVNGIQAIDLEASVGGLTQRLLEDGKINKGQLPIIKSLLESRYGIGEKAPHKVTQHIRNLTSLTLLGNFYSALRQGGELGKAIVVNGFKPSLEAIVQKLTGKQEVSAKEFGLADTISEEFASDVWSGKLLNKGLRINAFSAADIIGKDVFLNSSLINARTSKGFARIADKYKESHTPQELQQLQRDLASKNKSPLVKELLWNELNDVQPITKLETTQFGLNNPNARIGYSLKNFMLKEADWVRNNVYNEISKGDTKSIQKGLRTATKYMMIMGATQTGVNTMIDWAMGRDTNPDAFDIPLNVFKMFGMNDFSLNKVKDGKWIEVVDSLVLPPRKAWQEILNMDEKSLKYIPLPGARPLYELGLGGAEAYNKKQEARDKKEAKQ